MSKVIALLAVIAAGAATYVWLKKHGATSHLDSHMDDMANKVRSAFGADENSNHLGAELKEKAKDATDAVAEQVEAVGP